MTIFKNIFFAACLLVFGGSLSAQAAVLFSDNFNSENGGVPQLNYYGFANWNVGNGYLGTQGSVDLIGNGYFDFYPGNGLYVDLDGSTGQAGILTTKNAIDFAPGTYTLTYDLGGSQRGDVNTVDVNLGSLYSQTFVSNSSDPLTEYSDTFTVTTPTDAYLSFYNHGGDDLGDILDNVEIQTATSAVPEPPTVLLFAFAGASFLLFNIRKLIRLAKS